VLGHENEDTLFMRGHLARALAAQGKYAEAETMHREVLEVQQRVLGPEHEDTQCTARSLSRTLFASGQFAADEVLYVRSNH
jgi:hypothetical protein